MGRVTIDRNKSRLRAIYGPQARHLVLRRAEEIMDAAQEECPVSDREYTDSDGDHPGVLYRSHAVEEDNQPGWFGGYRVVANARYASFVFDGQGPEGPRRPNRWLTRALDRVAARHRGTAAR